MAIFTSVIQRLIRGCLLQSMALSLSLSLGLTSGFAIADPQPANPQVQLETDLGTLTLELFADKAPATVENFLRYCRDGFYVGTIFHRVIPEFVVQGGGMTFDYVKKETREPVVNESANGLLNQRGTLAMARLSDPDSATSQFFINLNDNPHLDAQPKALGYTVFGRVLRGMEVVDKITEEPQGEFVPQAPNLPIRILSVNILSAGETRE
jgi:peptidyl-prolyl cis-trans isomerase A (cyclophilin A)